MTTTSVPDGVEHRRVLRMLGFEKKGPRSTQLESWAAPDGSIIAVGVDRGGRPQWIRAHGELAETALEEMDTLG